MLATSAANRILPIRVALIANQRSSGVSNSSRRPPEGQTPTSFSVWHTVGAMDITYFCSLGFSSHALSIAGRIAGPLVRCPCSDRCFFLHPPSPSVSRFLVSAGPSTGP